MDEMDGGSPHLGSGQLPSSPCLSCEGKSLLFHAPPSAAAGKAPAFVVDHAGTWGNRQHREGLRALPQMEEVHRDAEGHTCPPPNS